ncbi:acetoacetate--CoA ligase [Dactylosporangium vinaceum]|uniref:Acetoacetate--CoA ligase n=1 Tax=Dactylosporangium vinaceum TaxID=53362 RepID=A0ABV5MSP3_9ACTN|nr:acetoacetate--CoA ligase [Dactylosporangium vinaceum]UAC00954.1 acetoacetate--CoA ligase [Dactylosporangium vinaceum]
MTGITEGSLLRAVPPDARATSELGRYLDWLRDSRGLDFTGVPDLWRWSVTDLPGFWGSIWDFFGVRAHTPPRAVLESDRMPGARWFAGATLNYAEHAVGRLRDPGQAAIIAYSQTREPVELTYGELADRVARARAGLRRLGVVAGDRVVGYLPNIPETVVAMLATASIGAIWAGCAPEFGVRSVVDRFAQLRPTVLLAVSGYHYGDRDIDRRDAVAAVRAALPTVRHVVHVPYGGDGLPGAVAWSDLLATAEPLAFEAVPFDHPLVVLFSSGTTGKPKAIVHGHGGILVEHLKNLSLSWDLRPGDRLLWFTSTAWMLWNTLVSGLLLGAGIVLIDGDPLYPDLTEQWRLAARTRATLVGASPGYLMACRKQGIEPARRFDLGAVRQLGVAGSPLPVEGFAWVHEQFGPDVLLNVGSGGTDLCTGIVAGSPMQPVYAGEMTGNLLGVDGQAFDEAGRPIVGRLGELVITRPLPSMPVGFWDDPGDALYRATYFERYPGLWCHGDWIRYTERGSCVITGRSDATLNRGGVRLGTAEFYRVVEEFTEVQDSLVVHLEDPDGGPGELLLYIVPADGVELDRALRDRLSAALRTSLSPRHVPDAIRAVWAVPRSRTGKKLEVPVKRVLLGLPPDAVASRDALLDPAALDQFVPGGPAGRAAR